MSSDQIFTPGERELGIAHPPSQHLPKLPTHGSEVPEQAEPAGARECRHPASSPGAEASASEVLLDARCDALVIERQHECLILKQKLISV